MKYTLFITIFLITTIGFALSMQTTWTNTTVNITFTGDTDCPRYGDLFLVNGTIEFEIIHSGDTIIRLFPVDKLPCVATGTPAQIAQSLRQQLKEHYEPKIKHFLRVIIKDLDLPQKQTVDLSGL